MHETAQHSARFLIDIMFKHHYQMFQPSPSPQQAKFRSYANVRKDLKELGESTITHTEQKSPLVAYPISSLLSQKENADLYSGWQCATQLHTNVYFSCHIPSQTLLQNKTQTRSLKAKPENSETALRALQGLSALLRLKLAHLNGDKTLSDKILKAQLLI